MANQGKTKHNMAMKSSREVVNLKIPTTQLFMRFDMVLANLYRELNRQEKTVDAREKVIDWCTNHIHPFNIRNLAALCSSDGEKDEPDWEQIRREGSFSFQDFIKELHKLASTTDYHHALKSVILSRNTSLARRLYYEGTYEDGLSFFEKYHRLPIRNIWKESAAIIHTT